MGGFTPHPTSHLREGDPRQPPTKRQRHLPSTSPSFPDPPTKPPNFSELNFSELLRYIQEAMVRAPPGSPERAQLSHSLGSAFAESPFYKCHPSSMSKGPLARPSALSANIFFFIIPDEVWAKGHMQTVHPPLLIVTVRSPNGNFHRYGTPIKVQTTNGVDELRAEPCEKGLLLERVSSPTHPNDYADVIPLLFDTGGESCETVRKRDGTLDSKPYDFTFHPIPGERYKRTAPFHEMRNHVGQPEVTWAGRAQTRRTSGDLRFLTRTDRGPLPQLVSEDDVEALRGQFELRVVIRSIQRPLQVVLPSATPPGRGHPAVLSSTASASSSSKKTKKPKLTASKPKRRKEDRSYAILLSRTDYVIRLLNGTGWRIEEAVILWRAAGSKEEATSSPGHARQTRVKKYLLIDNCGESAADRSARETDGHGGAGGRSGPDCKDKESKEDDSEQQQNEGMECRWGGATGEKQSPSSGSSGSGGGGTQRGRGVKAEGEDDKPRTMDGSSQPSTAVTASPVQLKQEAHVQDDGKRDSDGDGERATELTATEEAPSVSVAATSASDRPCDAGAAAAADTRTVMHDPATAYARLGPPSGVQEQQEQLPALERPWQSMLLPSAPLVMSPLPSPWPFSSSSSSSPSLLSSFGPAFSSSPQPQRVQALMVEQFTSPAVLQGRQWQWQSERMLPAAVRDGRWMQEEKQHPTTLTSWSTSRRSFTDLDHWSPSSLTSRSSISHHMAVVSVPASLLVRGHCSREAAPSLILVRIHNSLTGECRWHGSAVKVLGSRGVDEESCAPASTFLLLPRISAMTDPSDLSVAAEWLARGVSRVVVTSADGIMANVLDTLRPAPANADGSSSPYDRTSPFPRSHSNHCGSRDSGCPVAKPASRDSVTQLHASDDIHVLLHPTRQPEVEAMVESHGRAYVVLQPCLDYKVQLHGMESAQWAVAEVCLLWSAAGSRSESDKRRIKRWRLI